MSSAKNTVLGTCDFKQLVSAEEKSDVSLSEIEGKIAGIVAPSSQGLLWNHDSTSGH